MSAVPKEITIRWRPQPKQLKFLRACGISHPFDGGEPRRPIADIIGYGGAAGGGKSDALLGAGIIYCLTYPGARVGYFRRNFTQLEGPGGAIMRSYELLAGPLGARAYNSNKRRWTFPNGSILQFCYCERDEDVHNYQSQQFDVILFDEATQFSWYQVAYLVKSRMRSVRGYPTFAAMATNPGNVGHVWFKRFFVSVGLAEEPHRVEVEPGRYSTHVFIPSKLSDNKILEKADPTYRRKLESLPEIERRRLLEGDWDIAEGMAFEEWREYIHVCAPFKIPDEWIRFRSLDWGFEKPYAVYWYAVDFDGRLWVYRELYGWGGQENKGTREDPEDVAKKIMELEEGEDIRYAVADDSIFGSKQDNSPSIAEQFARAFGSKATHWQAVGKGKGSRVSGKLEFHHRLKWNAGEDSKWDGQRPMIVFFNTCLHAIRTIPALLLDENNPEDVNTDMEDHAYDSIRYGCMSRPLVPKQKPAEESVIARHKKKLAQKKSFVQRRVV